MGKRVRLIHWNAAEARERIRSMRAAGYDVDFELPSSAGFLRSLRADPPAAVLIDLTRLPSQGRDLALGIRVYKATRHVPLVFVEGDAEKVERIRGVLPDAVYTSWSRIRSALKQAIARPPAQPVVPESMLAGYAGTPLPKKLGIKSNSAVALVGAPEGFRKTLGDLPDGVRLRTDGPGDLTVWFTESRAELERGMARMSTVDTPLWIAWPKKTSALATDLTQQLVREAGLAAGLVDYKICAIDATWSALLFRRRKR